MKTKTTYRTQERQIMKKIEGYLRSEGFYVQRMNSGMIKTVYGMARLCPAGTPDLMCFRPCDAWKCKKISDCHLYFVEVKRPKHKPTPIQKAKMQELETYGACCIVATSVEELKDSIIKK